ncbi:unnamed protein product [Amoebophrya sp. A120]|nr:unnamed protein product [Amoebophrya sp. A120]|eukprot:GSA120T00010059001.1
MTMMSTQQEDQKQHAQRAPMTWKNAAKPGASTALGLATTWGMRPQLVARNAKTRAGATALATWLTLLKSGPFTTTVEGYNPRPGGGTTTSTVAKMGPELQDDENNNRGDDELPTITHVEHRQSIPVSSLGGRINIPASTSSAAAAPRPPTSQKEAAAAGAPRRASSSGRESTWRAARSSTSSSSSSFVETTRRESTEKNHQEHQTTSTAHDTNDDFGCEHGACGDEDSRGPEATVDLHSATKPRMQPGGRKKTAGGPPRADEENGDGWSCWWRIRTVPRRVLVLNSPRRSDDGSARWS